MIEGRPLFRFEREDTGDVTGFDLGHMTLVGDHGSVSSQRNVPSQAMMIYLSLTDLLNLVATLPKVPPRATVKFGTFEATDSSFWFDLGLSGGMVTISRSEQRVACVSVASLVDQLGAATEAFLRDPVTALPKTDSVTDDLDAARRRLDALGRSR